MLHLWRAAQTRSTATALAVALRGKQNGPHANTTVLSRQRKLMPNPSLNLRANGMPPGPRHSAGVHFLWRGPGGMPLSPG